MSEYDLISAITEPIGEEYLGSVSKPTLEESLQEISDRH